MTTGIPVILNKSVQNSWQIFYYQEFESLIFKHDSVCQEIQSAFSFAGNFENKNGFRREIVINAFPLLCTFFPQERSVYIGTRRFGRELAVLKLYEHDAEFAPEELKGDLQKLKAHVEKISSVSVADFPAEIEWVAFQNNLPTFWNKKSWDDVEERSREIYNDLVKNVSAYRSTLFEKVSDYGLNLTAQFDLIRVHLLKFLALLPSLDHDRSGKEVKRNLLESLRRLLEDSEALRSNVTKSSARPLPLHLNYTFKATQFIANFMPAGILAACVRFAVKKMAKRFIAGESIGTSHRTLRELKFSGREATLDQLGELVVSNHEADEYFEKVLQLINGLKEHIQKGERNKAGILCAHVSIKVSALCEDFRPQAFDATYEKVAPRLRRILLEAKREQVFINIDAEHYHYRNIVLRIFEKVLLETPELADYDQTGIVVQAYLRDGANHLEDVINVARKRKLRMPIRLVKGAYWDAETIEGEAHQFTPPQFLNKEESDIHFRQLAYKALQNHEHIQLAIGSHNLADHSFVEAVRELRFPQAPVIEHQCLHMTYEALSHGLARMSWPTRNYIPIGNLLVGMAYLVRRIMENSSQVGVLSIMRSHKKSTLKSAIDLLEEKKKNNSLVLDSYITQTNSHFAPARPLRLHLDDEREDLEKSISQEESKILFSQENWKNSTDSKVFSSSRPDLVVGTFKETAPEEALSVVEAAKAGLNSWWCSDLGALRRVAVLLRAADLMLIRRNELSSLMIFEAGKTRTEALADVDEAIDFINFYCRQEIQIQLKNTKVTNRGVISVIAPWNFPLAIPCGMTVAPLVAGNSVILKPAEQTPLIGQKLYELLIEAGVPTEVLHLIQGDGAKMASQVVNHPEVAGIVFTGSKTVGQLLYRENASKLVKHPKHDLVMQKKVITEMGGKNAIIVTNNCELDETVSGILYSAFAHSGQKCSAASRVIVHHEVRDALVARLVGAMKDIKVGEAMDPSTYINPLISEFDQTRVRNAVAAAKDEAIRVKGKIHIDRSFEKNAGYCVGPVLIELPFHQAKKADSWAQKEIFGPVIHLVTYHSLIEAVELFNSTEYALTGGIYSQSQDDIDFLMKFVRAGNLYVNRPNTGARVGIEPFGGFKLSGTGPKAGGTSYVNEFHFIRDIEKPAEVDFNWAKDSGYELHVSRPSLISVAGRLKRFNTFSSAVINQYEHLMGSVNEKEKASLEQFVNWINENLEDYLQGRHLNHVIPGQLSYNDLSLIRESGLFVTVAGRPTLKGVCYLLSALALGSGVSVASITEESYGVWVKIVDLAWKAGFSKNNLDISLMGKESLEKLFNQKEFSYMYAGALNQLHSEVYGKMLEGNALNEYMRSILSEVDGVDLNQPSSVLDQFVWTRSMAVNTMRHGAPLELN